MTMKIFFHFPDDWSEKSLSVDIQAVSIWVCVCVCVDWDEDVNFFGTWSIKSFWEIYHIFSYKKMIERRSKKGVIKGIKEQPNKAFTCSLPRKWKKIKWKAKMFSNSFNFYLRVSLNCRRVWLIREILLRKLFYWFQR